MEKNLSGLLEKAKKDKDVLAVAVFGRHRILKEGRIVLNKNEGKLYDIAILTIKEFEDFRPLYKSYLEAVEHG